MVSLMKPLWWLRLLSLCISHSTTTSFCPHLCCPSGFVVSFWIPCQSWMTPLWIPEALQRELKSPPRAKGQLRAAREIFLCLPHWVREKRASCRGGQLRARDQAHTNLLHPHTPFWEILKSRRAGTQHVRYTTSAKLMLIYPGAQLEGLRLQYQQLQDNYFPRQGAKGYGSYRQLPGKFDARFHF